MCLGFEAAVADDPTVLEKVRTTPCRTGRNYQFKFEPFEPKACVLGDVFFEKDAGKDAPADQDFGSRIAVVCLGRTKLTSC